MTFNSPDMKFTKKPSEERNGCLSYSPEDFAPVCCQSEQTRLPLNANIIKRIKTKDLEVRRKTLPESEKCDASTSFIRNKMYPLFPVCRNKTPADNPLPESTDSSVSTPSATVSIPSFPASPTTLSTICRDVFSLRMSCVKLLSIFI